MKAHYELNPVALNMGVEQRRIQTTEVHRLLSAPKLLREDRMCKLDEKCEKVRKYVVLGGSGFVWIKRPKKSQDSRFYWGRKVVSVGDDRSF